MIYKYCQHCAKEGHTDAECWSTRVVVMPPDRVWPWPASREPAQPPMTESEIRRIVREEIAKATKDQP